MFLFSGVLAPLVNPRPIPGSREGTATAHPELPAPVASILARAPRAAARRALTGETNFLVDPLERSFLMMETRMGCLVGWGDPVGDAGTDLILDDFLALARGGGRVPVIRNASEEHLPLYRSRGLVPHREGAEAVVELDRLDPRALDGTPLARRIASLEAAGITVEIVPPRWIGPLATELAELAPETDPAALARHPLAVVRSRGCLVAFASLWQGSDGGEVAVDGLRLAHDAPVGIREHLLLQLVLWARRNGFSRFVLGHLPRSGSGRPWHGERAVPSALLEALPVVREPRYTLRPRGVQGAWAALTMGAFTEESAHPA